MRVAFREVYVYLILVLYGCICRAGRAHEQNKESKDSRLAAAQYGTI